MTINQVIEQLREIAINHKQINTFGFNDFPEYGKSESITYPVMWVKQLPSSVDGNNLNLKYRLLFADLVHKDDSNQDEVSSDQMQTALDVIAQLQHPDYEWVYNATSNLEPVFGTLDDEITGWLIDIDLVLDNPYNRCAIPFDPSPTPEEEIGFVTIYDVDGITVIDRVSNNSYWIDTTTGGGSYNIYVNGILNQTGTTTNFNTLTLNITAV